MRPFLLSDVPGDVALAVGGMLSLAVTGLAGFVVRLIWRMFDSSSATVEALHDLADAHREAAAQRRGGADEVQGNAPWAESRSRRR